MKIVDFILILFLLLGAYKGYKTGFLIEIISFFAFIIAIISAFKLLNQGMNLLSPYLSGGKVMISFAAFVVIFLLVYLLIYFLGRLLKNTMNYTLIGKFDNVAGALLGMVKTGFAVSLLLWLSSSSKIEVPKSYTAGSYLYPELVIFAPKFVHWVSYVIPFQNIFPTIQELLRDNK